MKTKNKSHLVGPSAFAAIILLVAGVAFANTCYMNCSGNNYIDDCPSGCAGGEACTYTLLPPNMTWGTCSVPSSSSVDGCSDGFKAVDTQIAPGNCTTTACMCSVPAGTPYSPSTGNGTLCWQDCCGE